ncbi:MAG TPA: hypothetical protein VK975_05390, partial [Acidimicrobiales bacterium]|nr:hypothetical protein [Acidimicrobiales bacterium]
AVLSGPLAPPLLGDPGSWPAWAGGRTPLQAIFTLLGLSLVVVAWYLLVITCLQVATRLAGASALVSLTDLVTLPVVRRTVHAALDLGLAGSVMAGGAALPLPPVGAGPIALVSATTPDEAPPADEADPPVMRRVPDAVPAEPVLAAPAPPAADREWVVAPGDHLWSVATRVLEAAWAMPATDDQVADYWQRLIEANRDRLADPANPDLVFPGQVLTVVEPPPRGWVP